MKTIATVLLTLSVMLTGLAQAEVPERLVYTGALSDQGQPFEGSVDMVFSISTRPAGGRRCGASRTRASRSLAAG